MTRKPVGQIIKSWADGLKIKAEYFKRLDSTNNYAKNSKASLVITDQQTFGRGRGKNQWICSEYGDYFLTTWIFITSQVTQPILSPLVGLALYKALQKTWQFKTHLSLKAPNDIYLGSGKLAGILIETTSQSEKTKVLIGIGVNIFSHPKQLKNSFKATSLIHHLSLEEKLDEKHIKCFLSYLWQELYTNSQSALSESFVSDLTLSKRQEIKAALNKYPGQMYYQNVLPDGSLQTTSDLISWQDI